MSSCIFIASDFPLDESVPSQEYHIEINVDTGTVNDGGADDNYYLRDFSDVGDYTNKKYGVYLEWSYTEGRAVKIIEYIKNVLCNTDTIELWNVWLMDYCEFEDRPFIHKKTVSVKELGTEHIKYICNAKIWNAPDKRYPDRPSFYCLSVTV